MKKNKSLRIITLLASTLTLVGCGGTSSTTTDSPVATAIKDAEKLHFDAILEKAKTEVGSNEVKVFGNSSTIQKACEAFTTEYGIKFTYEKVGDSDLYTQLSTTIPAKKYTADFVFAQDGNMMKSTMLDTGYLLNYLPLDYKDVLSADDLNPATGGIAFNKVFMYNNTDYNGENAETAKRDAYKNYLTNIWQIAGSDADKNHISDISFKDPSQENINMNMLIMLTSDTYVEKLTTAYKDYYGKDYVAESQYPNIGFKWIKEFLDNIVYHSSDGTECKNLASGNGGKMAYVNFNKLKDCSADGIGAEDDDNLTTAMLEGTVEGFGGFIYKMYPLIPNNAKYPYAACAFENYILSTNGYQKGWSGLKGYYSCNPNNDVAEGDKPLSYWKQNCVIEDPTYIVDNYAEVSDFITTNKPTGK